MGTPGQPEPTKFFCGLLSGPDFQIEGLLRRIETLWGPVERVYGPIPFDFTNYYDQEMGSGLVRRFISFAKLFERDKLVERKHEAIGIEQELSQGSKRTVNIDPGYLTLGQLILSTTKDRDQRIYIGRGIYAEVTLRYSKRKYHQYPWTYIDYCSPKYHECFLDMRASLKAQLAATKA